MTKITFPHMGNMDIALKFIFKNLGSEVIVPPPISDTTLSIGVRHSPEQACLPFKLNLGNYIEAIDRGAEVIIMLGGIGPCRFGYYGQVQKEILEDLGYDVDMIIVDPPDNNFMGFLNRLKPLFCKLSFKNIINSVLIGLYKIKVSEELERQMLLSRACDFAKVDNIYKNYIRKIDDACSFSELHRIKSSGKKELKSYNDTSKNYIKIALVGEIYCMLEPYPSQNITRTLNSLGVKVVKTDYLYDYLIRSAFKWKEKKIEKIAYPYLKRFVGGHGMNSVADTIKYARSCDGVIHIMPFSCAPEVVARGILSRVSDDLSIPLISLSYDENTGTEGYTTRLEAFVDMLSDMRKRRQFNGESIFGH